jgi:hypothetical protein
MTEPTTQIAVLDRGFVYVGICSVADDMLTITDARCIRRWGTTGGLGQLALSGPTASTKLDKAGTVRAPIRSVIHMLDTASDLWPALAA